MTNREHHEMHERERRETTGGHVRRRVCLGYRLSTHFEERDPLDYEARTRVIFDIMLRGKGLSR